MDIAFIPYRFTKWLGLTDSDAPHVNALLSCCALAALFLWPAALRLIDSIPHICLFKFISGLPCPGCGITTALIALTQLEVRRSVQIQPCALVLVCTLLIQSSMRAMVLMRLTALESVQGKIAMMNTGMVALLLMFWVFRLSIHNY